MNAFPLKVEPPPTRREIRAGRDPHVVTISTDQPAGIRGRSIAVMTGKGLQDDAWTQDNRALAARLVQCFNACIGIEDPAAFIQSAHEDADPPETPTAPNFHYFGKAKR